MDILTIAAIAVSFASFTLSALARMAASSGKTAPYAELLRQIERVFSEKPLSTRPLEDRLDEAVQQLTSASERVGGILTQIQADVDKKRREADHLGLAIQELRREYAENQSLANLTAEEASAVRQLLTREVSALKRRSYWPDVLINFGVAAFFFVLGIVITRLLGQ